jgi:hypothetical protein
VEQIAMLQFLQNNNSVTPKLLINAALVAVKLGVACSINVNITLAQTIENRLLDRNTFRDVLVQNFYVRGKIRYPFGHIYMEKTGISSDV